MALKQITQQDILDLFDRFCDEGYLADMKAGNGPGYEYLQGVGKLQERVSLAVTRLDQGLLVRTAKGGKRATGQVWFYRADHLSGAVTMKIGTKVMTSAEGLEFVTTADAVFGPADLGPVLAPVEAVAEGYEWNVTGEVTTGDGTVLPGEIDTITLPMQDPVFADQSIRVKQIASIADGAPPMLDALGDERGIRRNPGEADDVYRARVSSLSDTISPDAMRRALDALTVPLGVSYDLIETFESRYQTCYDAPQPSFAVGVIHAVPKANLVDGQVINLPDGVRIVPFELDVAGDGVTAGNLPMDVSGATTAAQVGVIIATAVNTALAASLLNMNAHDDGRGNVFLYCLNPGVIGNVAITHTVTDPGFSVEGMAGGAPVSVADPNYDPNLWCYDDPRPASPFRGRYLDAIDHAAAVIVVLPNLPAMRDVGMAYDDTATTIADHMTSIGQRAHNAYDMPDSGANASILQGGYDGFDLPKDAFHRGTYDLLQGIKAAGVSVELEIDGQ